MKTIVLCLLVGAIFETSNGRILQRKIPVDPEVFEDILNLTMSLKDSREFKATVNEYADKILVNMNKLLKIGKMDPIAMKDIYKGYWWGNLQVNKIELAGLSTLSRDHDAVMIYNHINKQLQLDLPITIKQLKFSCHFKASIMLVGPSGTITGDVDDVLMNTSIVIDFNFNQALIRLFEIPDSGHIKIHIHSNVFSDWMYNLISDATTALFHDSILGAVSGVIQGALQNIVEVIDKILEDILG